MEAAIISLINNYKELNSPVVDELKLAPSPLEFMRYVAQNRPFVVRKAAIEWKAYLEWDAEALRENMEGQKVNVSITPFGNADAVVVASNGKLCFVEPYERAEDFTAFLDYVSRESRAEPDDWLNLCVKYAQTQNDNLRHEYENLFQDVPKDIAFARIALQKEADAINLWIGNQRSVTSLHKDNYENIYVQIRGQKHFVLIPPAHMPCTNEQPLPRARYKPTTDAHHLLTEQLTFGIRDDSDLVPIAMWDPDKPLDRTSRFSHLAEPLRVTLEEGDMLYLPAMWYHKVSQSPGEEGFALAVNYWYDMDFSGGFYTANNFLQDVTNA